MWVGLLIDRINNKLEKSNLINEHALNREPHHQGLRSHILCILGGTKRASQERRQISEKPRYTVNKVWLTKNSLRIPLVARNQYVKNRHFQALSCLRVSLTRQPKRTDTSPKAASFPGSLSFPSLSRSVRTSRREPWENEVAPKGHLEWSLPSFPLISTY